MTTVSKLIIDALKECNITSDLDSYSEEELTDTRATLNQLMVSLPDIGKQIFQREEGSQSFSSEVSSFILPSTYYDLDYAYLSYNGFDSDLSELSIREYRKITNKSSEGRPTHYALFYKKDFTVEVKLYPKPNITGESGYLFKYIGILNHINYNSNTSDLLSPSKYDLALKWSLANELSNKFDVPVDKQLIIEKKAKDALRNVKENNLGRKTTFITKGAF